MPVRIRLSRIGKKQAPFYRIIAVDGRKKRDGEYLEDLGTYDAVKTQLVRYNDAGIQKWISVGAQPSETVQKLMKLYKRGGIAPAMAAEPVVPVKTAEKKPVKKVEEPSETQPTE
jgi:small subunit ribosomal protein S16